MARRCTTNHCPKPRANWWREALGVNWLSSSQGVPDETADGKQAFLTIGNSINAGLNATGASTLPVSGTAYEFDRNSNTVLEFGAGAGIAGFSFNSKSPWAKFAVDYYTATGKKPVIINRGASSSTVSTADNNNDWQTTGTNYNAAVTAANLCLSQLGLTKLKGIIVGEILINDVQGLNGTGSLTVAQINTALTTLIDNLRAEFGTDVPIIFNTPGRTAGITTSAKLSGCRKRLKDACTTYANVYIGATLSAFQVGGYYSDQIHPNTNGNDALGSMFARWFSNSAYSKWARSIISCHFHELTTPKKDDIETWLTTWQTQYLQCEFLYASWKKFNDGSELNCAFDWTFLSAPIIDGGFTVSADSHIATNGTTQYFDGGHNRLLSPLFITTNDLLEGIKIKSNSTPAGTNAIAFGVTDASSLSYLRQLTTSQIAYTENSGGAATYAGETALTAGSWAVKRVSGTMSLHKNGTQVDSEAFAALAFPNFTTVAGAANGIGTIGSFMNGQFERYWLIPQSAISNLATWESGLDTLQN